MNIKITDEILYKELLNSSFVKIEIGSKMYGLEHKNSDTDILCIYHTSDIELFSIQTSHHQIQYKDVENNIDYLFINIHSFLRNILSGDSTINFEVINSKKLINTELEFLYNNRLAFYNYKIIRSYLGLARRDLKRIDINTTTNFQKNKKIAHAYRGLHTAISIYYIKYSNRESYSIKLQEYTINYIKNEIWTLPNFTARKSFIGDLNNDINDFRLFINEKFNKKELVNYMSIKDQETINKSLYKLLKSSNKKMNDFNQNIFYDANENDVKY